LLGQRQAIVYRQLEDLHVKVNDAKNEHDRKGNHSIVTLSLI
jgi:hypothetical protein